MIPFMTLPWKAVVATQMRFYFNPILWKIPILTSHIFQRGWFNQLTIPFGKFDGTTPKRWRKIRGHHKPIHGGWAIYFAGGIAGNRLPFPQKRPEVSTYPDFLLDETALQSAPWREKQREIWWKGDRWGSRLRGFIDLINRFVYTAIIWCNIL